jgi:HAD superfamily hydrolase (TIGR01490 family)
MENISSNGDRAKRYIAFFDLDRTITDEISGNTLVKVAWRKGLMKWYDLAAVMPMYILYKLNRRDPLKVIESTVSRVKGMPVDTMRDLCSVAFSEILFPSVYNEAVAEINFHREHNAKVVILSSAPDLICNEMSLRLGLDDAISTALESAGGYLTGKPLGRFCYGEEKLTRLLAYCKNNTMNPGDSWYYSDSISDLPVLGSVGYPVCINPDNALRHEARLRGWKIHDWHN